MAWPELFFLNWPAIFRSLNGSAKPGHVYMSNFRLAVGCTPHWLPSLDKFCKYPIFSGSERYLKGLIYTHLIIHYPGHAKTFLNGQFGNLCRVHPTKVNIPNTTLWVEICNPQPRLWGATHNVPLEGTSIHPSICPSATFWFFNILKRQWWNFIKFGKHIDIHKMNIYNRKIMARGQFF